MLTIDHDLTMKPGQVYLIDFNLNYNFRSNFYYNSLLLLLLLLLNVSTSGKTTCYRSGTFSVHLYIALF